MAVRFNSGIDYGQLAQGIEQDIQTAGQFFRAGVETFMDKKIQEQKFANTVLENIESLKEEGDLAHQKILAEEVDKLYNEAKGNIYKYRTTKKGKTKFDGFDFDPEVLRDIKNKTRNLKNAALRSEQLRPAYDQTIKSIATDPTILNKSAAIQQATEAFRDRNILFKGDSINPDNPVLTFSKIVEDNVDLPTAINSSIGVLAGGRTTDVGFTTPDGRSEVIQYNVDYYTPKYSGNKVVGFEPNEQAINQLALSVFSSRDGIATRASFDQVKQEVMQALDPIAKVRITPPKPRETTEADIKRRLEAKRYTEAEAALESIAVNKISQGKKLDSEDFSLIQKAVGKDALKNIDFVDVDEVKKEYSAGSEKIVKQLKDKKGFFNNVGDFIKEYEANEITLDELVEKSTEDLGSKKMESINELYSEIAPLSQYVTKDYGYVIKDKRGKDKKLSFVENRSDFEAFTTSLFDVPETMDIPFQFNPDTSGQQKATIPGF